MNRGLGPDLEALRDQALAARAEIARLGATSPDVRGMISADRSLRDLADVRFDDLVTGPATDGAIARALANLRESVPTVEAMGTRRKSTTSAVTSSARSGAAVTSSGRFRAAVDDAPSAQTGRIQAPARHLPRPVGAQLALLLRRDHHPTVAPTTRRAVSTAPVGKRMERVSTTPPSQGRTALTRAGADRPISARRVAPAAVGGILAGAAPAAALIAAEVLGPGSTSPPDRSAVPPDAKFPKMLASALSRWSIRTGSTASDRRATTRPADATGVQRSEPSPPLRAPDPPRRNALARLAAAGRSVGRRDTPDAIQPDATERRQPAALSRHDAAPEAIERSPSASRQVSPDHASDGELGERLARILRREARRAGIDLTGGWP